MYTVRLKDVNDKQMEDIDCDRSNSYDFSESDCLTVTSSANQSHEMQNLVSTNEKLKYELEGYKRQYDEALSYMKQFEDLQGVVSELRKENSKLVAEKDELARRLEISLMKNDELATKESHESLPNFVLEISELKHQLKNDKEEHEKALTELNRKVQEREDVVNAKTKEIEQLQSTLDKIVAAGQERFSTTFATPSDFHTFLRRPAVESKPETSVGESDSTHEELEAKIRYFKKLAKTQVKARKKMEGICDAVERQAEMKVVEADKIVSGLEKQITAVQEEVKQRDENHKREIAARDAEIKSLRAELDNAKRDVENLKLVQAQRPTVLAQPQIPVKPIQAAEDVNEWKEKVQEQAEKLKEAAGNVSSMRKRVMFLSSQVKTLEAEKKVLERKDKEYESRIDELTNSEKELQERYDKLQTEKDEIEVQLSYNSSRAKAEQASSSKAKVKIEAMTNELAQQKLAVTKAEQLIECQKKEIAKYNKERHYLIALMEKHSSLALIYDKKCLELKQEVGELRRKLKAEQTKPIMKQQPQPEEKKEEVPWNVWANPELPKPLLDKIIQIAKLNDLPLSHRIPQVMAMIVAHYKEANEENEENVKNMRMQFDSQISAVNRFLSGIGKVVDQCDLSVSLLQDPFASHDVIEKMTKLRQLTTELQEQAAAQEEKTLSLLVKLQANTVSELQLSRGQGQETCVKELETGQNPRSNGKRTGSQAC